MEFCRSNKRFFKCRRHACGEVIDFHFSLSLSLTLLYTRSRMSLRRFDSASQTDRRSDKVQKRSTPPPPPPPPPPPSLSSRPSLRLFVCWISIDSLSPRFGNGCVTTRRTMSVVRRGGRPMRTQNEGEGGVLVWSKTHSLRTFSLPISIFFLAFSSSHLSLSFSLSFSPFPPFPDLNLLILIVLHPNGTRSM